ncbi:hypothetical protein FACS1894189_2040 [Planctomycetales bacterium]|nr:hypothetical protein FACS1894189_2040 [Planctomycetales bacterium]
MNVCFFLIFGLTLASSLVIGLFFAAESAGSKEGMARMTNFSGILVMAVSLLLLTLLVIVIFLSRTLGHTLWGTIFALMVCSFSVGGSDRTPVAWWFIVPIGAVFCVLSLNIQVSDALAACADVDSYGSDTETLADSETNG